MWCLKYAIGMLFFIGLANAYVEELALQPEGRVINGTDSDIRRYPFMVSLRLGSSKHGCGGTIIAPKFILTAAHCVLASSASTVTIQYSQTIAAPAGPNVVPVKKIYVHEKFNPLKFLANDIALLELYGSFIFNYETLAPVQLPEQDFETEQTLAGEPGVLLGWGFNTSTGGAQEHLQEADLKIYSNAECRERYGKQTNPDYHICGGVDEGWKGQCSFDSGGPLLLYGRIQVGIVSWCMKPCTVYPYPGVYTKVSKFVNWIKGKMAGA